MDKLSLCTYSNSSLQSDNTSCENISAQLKRLKIQECLIIKRLHDMDGATSPLMDLETQYLKETKTSFQEIKNLYEDIKSVPLCEKELQELNLEDLRKTIHELDIKITIFKNSIQNDLAILKLEENQLEDKVCNNTPKRRIIRIPKTQHKAYNAIIPSPVRNMIKSPLKCPQVQEFQIFLANSPNRYGGWKEYNHNIFVGIWLKYFNKNDMHLVDENAKLDDAFVAELREKLPGLKEDEITSHYKWYSKFVYYEKRQNTALKKWRKNKNILLGKTSAINDNEEENRNSRLTKPRIANGEQSDIFTANKKAKDFNSTPMNSPAASYLKKETELEKEKYLASNIFRPTKQWNNRCNSEETPQIGNDVNKIIKLRMPRWRLGLSGNSN